MSNPSTAVLVNNYYYVILPVVTSPPWGFSRMGYFVIRDWYHNIIRIGTCVASYNMYSLHLWDSVPVTIEQSCPRMTDGRYYEYTSLAPLYTR